jgi:hypothetical protein
MRIPESVKRDARAVAGGLYRLNARGADRYGFAVADNGREVGVGEFLWPRESEVGEGFDGILDLATGRFRQPRRA